MSSAAKPSPELAARIGGAYEDYERIGREQRGVLESRLPADWSFSGKSVLDFGCGPGRTLAPFAHEASTAEFVGCDIHPPAIDWARTHLSPPFAFFLCDEAPPLDQPDERFDLIYAMSVFTHITNRWGQWLAELHRKLRPGGLILISTLGQAMVQQVIGADLDERIGMLSVNLHKDWESGGPDVLLSEWWVREHWGRGFEILRYDRHEPSHGPGQDFVLMRKRELTITADVLEAVDPEDPREYASLACNLEVLQRQQRSIGLQLHEARRIGIDLEEQELGAGLAMEAEIDVLADGLVRRNAELARLRGVLRVITTSNSWRLTRALRRTRAITGKRP